MSKIKNRDAVAAIPEAPAGDPAFMALYDARMRWPVRRAWLQVAVRDAFQTRIGAPFELAWFRRWEQGRSGGRLLERLGLPRRAVEARLGDALTIEVDPRALIRSVDWRGNDQRPTSSAFIWDGDWDLRRGDLRHGSRYRFISDLDEHRDDLRRTERFRHLHDRLLQGEPWVSHQQGVLLDSDERILTYLRAYLSFLDDMTVRGFDAARGKDELGVAVTREGHLLKINRGLHRLAMAQRIGLPAVPVRIRSVHRQWWQRVTAGARGEQALQRMATALRECRPEARPGQLDSAISQGEIEWPAPRLAASATTRPRGSSISVAAARFPHACGH
ncbi:hypothetical protein [Modicisalibacter radicis]|uniref:hypothetical protein n=1 Tax=Halomonas sp. EAR18 TaxID=2518972 RepID=UPI001B353A5B|nr:hypothetical protein [Halomonas sp. EAR18]